MINLFYAPNACSLVSHFAKSEQRQPEYLAINSKERVRRVSAVRACAYARVRETRSTFWLSAAVITD